MTTSSKLNARGVQSCLFVLVMLVFAFALAPAFAEVKLTDNLSLSGFLDMSSVITDNGDDTAASLSFDQFELDFHFDYGSVTGRVDIDSTGTFIHPGEDINEGQRVILEQGFVTYTLPEDTLSGVSITTGRFLSTFGFETAEPTVLRNVPVVMLTPDKVSSGRV